MSKGNKFKLWIKFKKGSKNPTGTFPTRRSSKKVESWAKKFLKDMPYVIAHLYTVSNQLVCIYHPTEGRLTQNAWDVIKQQKEEKKPRVKPELEVKIMMLLDQQYSLKMKMNKEVYPVYFRSTNPVDVNTGMEDIVKVMKQHKYIDNMTQSIVYVNGVKVAKGDEKFRFSAIGELNSVQF